MYASTPEEIREFQERIRAQNPEAKCVGIWEPNPCWYCSGSFVDGKHVSFHHPGRGTGQDPLNPELPCPHCSKFVDANPGRKLGACLGYGPQMLALQASDFEVGIAGVKGWGKTECATYWMIRGNLDDPLYDKKGQPILTNHSYGYSSDFRGMILRKNEKDLRGWLSFAESFYSTQQPAWKYSGSEFKSEAGAHMFIGHLKDSSSWEHAMGQGQLHRLWIDEAGQISQDLYQQLYSSVRSKKGNGLRCQILMSWNWIGPGLGWLREAFLEERDYQGNSPVVFKSSTRVIETSDGKAYRSRILITGGLRDNPKLGREYEVSLRDLKDPKLRKAYLEGDPYAMSGTFFGDLFRPHGPQPGEPENADHVVIKAKPEMTDMEQRRVKRHKINRATGYPELSPYWPRAIGGDWGYAHDAAFHWGCQDPETKQLHIYREHGVNRTTARQLGIQVASLCSDELEHLPGHAMTLYFSPDAFSKLAVDSGPRCYADMLAAGIGEVLGPDAVWVPESELKALEERRDELVMGDTEAYEQWKKAFLAQQKKGITIRKANNDRVLGAMRFRELMIWENPHTPLGVTFDWDTYIGILHEKGELEARKYAAQFQRHDGVYPRLQIWDCCERLIEVLPKLVHQDDTKIGANPEDVDKSHIPGMDFYDSGRHIVLAFAEQKWVAPLEEQRRAMVEQYRRQSPNITTQELIWAQQRFDAQHAQDGGNVVRIGRESGDQGRSLRSAQRKMLQ